MLLDSNNIILIPLYKIKNTPIEYLNKYKQLVDLNIDNIKKLNIQANIQIINKSVNN